MYKINENCFFFDESSEKYIKCKVKTKTLKIKKDIRYIKRQQKI
jgi:hypothetical protein